MSKRTLPDELRSVLLAHALQAPDPTDTVHRVLAATVAAEQPRSTSWWRGRNLLAAGAAAVLVLVLGGLGFVIDQAQHSSSTAGKAISGANLSGPTRAADGQVANPQLGSGRAEAPQRPYIAPGDAVGLPAPAAPSGLNCAQLLPGSRPVLGSATKIRLTGVDHDLYVYDFLCVLSDSQRSASTVAVYAQVGGTLRLQAVLVPASAGYQTDYMGTSDGDRVLAVQLFTQQRTLIRQDFSTGDGVHFTPRSFPVAPACTASDLTARIAQVDSISSAVRERPYAVQLTKQSPGICVLSGYLTVTAADGRAAPTLRGLAGGWGGIVPPIVQLAQGTTVSAMIEPADQPKCAPSSAVAVSLPDGSSLGVLPAGVALCGAQVHPIVSGNRGSS
jgi:hypothetical protein